VRIKITDATSLQGLLRPGLSVEVSVNTASEKQIQSVAAGDGWLFGAAIASETK
jgi:multidrug resistance efflux pump